MRKTMLVIALSLLAFLCAMSPHTAFSLNDTTRSNSTRRLHIETFWAIAKYRPLTASLPQQLNTNLNANLFLGWKIIHDTKRDYLQRVSIGGFAGIGTSRLSPSTTDHRIIEKYNAAIGTYGAAVLMGWNRFSGGIAVGVDHVMDTNRSLWIYQGKAWYGLTIGIKLNQ